MGSSVTGRGAYYNGDGSTRAGSPQLERIINGHAGYDDDDDEYGFGDEEFNARRRDAGRIIDRLTRAWNNEIGAPELLKFPKRLIERTVKELASRKALVRRATATADGDDALYLQASLVATENMRISHVLKFLLRERIYKIEQCAEYYLAQEDVEERMYHNEIAHAERYVELVQTYMNTAAMDAMPEQIARNPPPSTLAWRKSLQGSVG
ncbi:GINS complex subunit [Microbotryomycetes sp. JL201]|nr:GINS complex subunit [Microbotryomycetes sp. JL201]